MALRFITALLIFVLSLAIFSAAALHFPTLFNIDTDANVAASRYLAEHKQIPKIEEFTDPIPFTPLGTSRLQRPPLTFIAAATTQSALADKIGVIRAQRMAAALLAALCVAIVYLAFHTHFRSWTLAVSGTLIFASLPKFLLLASSNNDDMGALLSVSVTFAGCLALKQKGACFKALVMLAVGFGLILQTKFTAWLVWPWLAAWVVAKVWRSIRVSWWQGLVLILLFITAGAWWPLMNMIYYGPLDPTGLGQATSLQVDISQSLANRQGYAASGISLWQMLANEGNFLWLSASSFVGYIEWLDLKMSLSVTVFYAVFIVSTMIVSLAFSAKWWRTGEWLNLIALAAIVAQVIFYLHHNWLRDIQPQARYVLPVWIMIVYLGLSLLTKIPPQLVALQIMGRKLVGSKLIAAGCAILALGASLSNASTHLRASYSGSSPYLRIGQVFDLQATEIFDATRAEGIEWFGKGSGWQLRRTRTDKATIPLHSLPCEPTRVLLLQLRVQSPLAGSIQIRNLRKPQDIVWQPVSAGESLVSLPLRSEDCDFLMLEFGPRLQILDIIQLSLLEMQTHRYGQPILVQ